MSSPNGSLRGSNTGKTYSGFNTPPELRSTPVQNGGENVAPCQGQKGIVANDNFNAPTPSKSGE